METDLSVVMRHVRQPPADFRAIFAELDIRCIDLPVETSVSGWFQWAGGEFSALINSNYSEQRQRLVAAHNLAIFLLYRDKFAAAGRYARHTFNLFGEVDPCAAEDSPLISSSERMCNKLAIQMMMPAATIQKLWKELGDQDAAAKINILADRFAVSAEAMKIRANTLNLIERPQRMPEMPSLAPTEPVLA